ncbi:hypothetical protein GOQ27_10605 [Clostridium sp. D2Q-11]|uniref:Uncharacterized protein n=1 Tax=Anaeromonas frigoriresistens TaxID=2683708 RepID=A0A942UUP0_9FIRM|nr:hypothetical protein [Anaeromonas frigoriresistens]MBS4538918.1 hypothetical protein [Anaeromonas frigoriresistens]
MGYKKLFWGFIFFFDFRLSGFDILPDIIGYILFYQGLNMLYERNEHFDKAKRFAIPLILLSVFSIYEVTVPLNEFTFNSYSILILLIGVAATILNLMMIYNICIGISEEARRIEDNDLETKALNRWKLYFVTNLLVLTVLIVRVPFLLAILFIPIIILSLISFIFMLILMNIASNKLKI